MEASNYNEDASIGLSAEAGLYVEGGSGVRKSLGSSSGAAGGRKGGAGGGSGGGGVKRAAPCGPWVRANRLRCLPEVLSVELGAPSGEAGRPMAECVGLPTLTDARAAAASLATQAGAASSSALAAADNAVRFIAASALVPARYPARRFCAVCGAPGRYPFPGGVEYVCSVSCRGQFLETAHQRR